MDVRKEDKMIDLELNDRIDKKSMEKEERGKEEKERREEEEEEKG